MTMKRIEMTIRSVMPYFERFDLQPLLPKVIIIDEPELGLHPIAITKLSGLIKSVLLDLV